MQIDRRRVLLAGTAAAACGTVAAASLWRKPDTPPIATLIDAGPPALRRLGQIVPADTPAPPADAGFTDADGAPKTLASYAGMGLVVNLWATWCAPCVAEMPALQEMARKLAADGIVVLPLSSDRGGAAVVRKFYDAHAITGLPILLDQKGEAGRAWGARGLPTTLLIDRSGRERARLEGAFDWSSNDALATIRRLIG
jgi:thiol-disulfide isomerase/thioredoxin